MRRLALAISLLCLVIPAAAHVPVVGGGGDSLENAYLIAEPKKSWVHYGAVLPGESRFFAFNVQTSLELYAALHTPVRESAIPHLVLIEADGSSTQAPTDLSWGYEPFTPSALREVAEFEQVLGPGTYFLRIDGDPTRETNFALAIGRQETFTAIEWARVPADRIGIHTWEGQPFVMTILGELIGFLVAGTYWWRGGKNAISGIRWSAVGVLGGSGLTVLFQGFAALRWSGWSNGFLVTLALVAVSAGFTYAVWRITRETSPRRRMAVLVLALVAPFLWTGLYAGSLLLLGWGIGSRMQAA